MYRFALSTLFSIMLLAACLTCSQAYTNNQSSTEGIYVEVSTKNKGNPNVTVWVNTNSGVYHCKGGQWYGRTRQGEYMSQKRAQERGYRPAYGRVCE